MDAKVYNVAREWARGGLTSPRLANLIKARYTALFEASLTDGGLDNVTNATKNGISMGKQVGLSAPDTLIALGRAVDWINQGLVPSGTRGRIRF